MYIHYISGKTKSQVNEIYLKLMDDYKDVIPYIGRFKGTAEYYGHFECYKKISKKNI